MQASVIIPSLNSPIIDRILDRLRAQSAWANLDEILVVGKDDAGLVGKSERVRLVDTGEKVNAPRARNIGINEAKNDLLVFLDSDCLPSQAWLQQHIAAQEAGYQVVGGGIIPDGDNYWSRSYNLSMFHEYFSNTLQGARPYLPTLNLSVQREAIAAGGTLDEKLARGQDIEWTVRMAKAGYGLYLWPLAAVYHQHNRTTFGQVWRDCARSGYYMREIRLANPQALQAPGILRHRKLILFLSPAIAAWVTGRIVIGHRQTFGRHWQTIPAIYMTKIAWCWGASRSQAPQ